jgi:hippurate hydrolase
MKTIENIRRDLHKIPEVGFKEYKTKKYILNYLKGRNLEIFEFSSTGIDVYFHFNKRKTICLRTELDALPINEENDVSYKSIHQNFMHACGHDGHMAILLSLIDDICEEIVKPKHNVLFLFQPSEEISGGGLEVINSGVLEKYKVEEIYALHIWPNLEKGEIFTKVELFAEPIEFDIEIRGKNSHVGSFKEGKDALYTGIELLHDIKKETNLIGNTIFHIGEVFAYGQRNIVCDNFLSKGTIRVFDDNSKNSIFKIIEKHRKRLKKQYNLEINVNYNYSLFPLINTPNLINKSLEYGVELLEKPYFHSEDFSLYLQKIKGVYFLLGGGDIPPLHSSNFNFDEEILNVGKELFIKVITN